MLSNVKDLHIVLERIAQRLVLTEQGHGGGSGSSPGSVRQMEGGNAQSGDDGSESEAAAAGLYLQLDFGDSGSYVFQSDCPVIVVMGFFPVTAGVATTQGYEVKHKWASPSSAVTVCEHSMYIIFVFSKCKVAGWLKDL